MIAKKENTVSLIPKPPTQKEMVDQLWFAIIGSNGDGLATQIKDTHSRVKKLENIIPDLMTCDEYDKREAEKKKEENKERQSKERRKLRPFDRWMLILTAGTMLFIGIQSVTGIWQVKHDTEQTKGRNDK